MIEHNYKLKFNDEGYIISFEAVDNNDYDYHGQLALQPNLCKGWTKFIDGNFIEDETKKAIILAKASNKERQEELHKLLDDSDYIIAKAFEQIMSLNNPLTFVSDLINITTLMTNHYGDTIANRQKWREELEELEVSDHD